MSTEPHPQTVAIANDHLSARISALGAELQSLEATEGTAGGTGGGADEKMPLLWHGDPAWWSGRAPILFPIVGRAPGDRITTGTHSATMAQHGFARRSLFTLSAQDATSCRHVLEDSEASRALYPFAFALEVTHRLDGPALHVTARVRNTGTAVMPFGLGFHPAFLWPLPEQEGRPHHIRLDNGAEPALARLEGGLLAPARHPSPFTAGRLELAPAMFEADAMIFPEGAGTGLRYGVEGGPELAFRFHNLPNLAIWSKPGAPFVCIEPWHGLAATVAGETEIAERPFSLQLEAGAEAEFGYELGLVQG